MTRAGHRSSTGSQAGMTVIELLLFIGLCGIIIGPLAAWTMTTVRQQGTTADLISNAVATGRLNSSFSDDVASARLIDAPGNDCGSAATPGGGGTVALSIQGAGVDQLRIVYTVARPDGASLTDPERSLWRRECNSSGTLTSAVELFRDVRPGSVSAQCPTSVAPPLAQATLPACRRDGVRRVLISLTPKGPGSSPRAIELHATRRADSRSIGISGGGNRPPIAQITVDSLIGFPNEAFSFSGAASEDRDGPASALSHVWEFPAPNGTTASSTGVSATHSFSEVGEYTVLLTVADARGATNVAAVTVRVINRHPVALARVTPETGEVGLQVFDFDARTSSDADGDTLSYQWDLGPGAPGTRITDTRPQFGFVFPAGTPQGLRQVSLTVTDSRGGTDTMMLQVAVRGPAQIGGITINPEPVLTGSAPVVGTVGPGRPNLDVSFSLSSGDPAAATWQLIGPTGSVLRNESGATFTHSFLDGQHGQYRVERVAAGGVVVGEPRTFRVNAAPVAGFIATGATAAAPRAVDFASVIQGGGAGGSSDVDGTIVAWRWNFGFFDAWASSSPMPTHVFTHPGRYTVRLEVVDDAGARTSTEQVVEVSGPQLAPPAPTWSGEQLRLVAVPGAETYRVNLTCNGVAVVPPPSDVPAAAVPVVVVPTAVCPSPGVAAATVQTSLAAVWSPVSTQAVRP